MTEDDTEYVYEWVCDNCGAGYPTVEKEKPDEHHACDESDYKFAGKREK